MISAKISNTTRQAVYRRDGFRCAICDSTKGLQIHHVIPRSHGGGHTTPHNLITLCMYCHNIAHGTRWHDQPDWMTPEEMQQACFEYLADYYAPNHDPWHD